MSQNIDLGGNTIVCEDIKIGATVPGIPTSVVSLSSTELTVLDAASNANSGTGKAVITGTSGALTVPGVLTNAGGYTSVAGAQLYSGTAVPAGGTAGSGLKVSSVANLGIFFGSGAPTLSAAQGSLYLRTDGSSTSTRLYVNSTGSTTWVNFTSAS